MMYIVSGMVSLLVLLLSLPQRNDMVPLQDGSDTLQYTMRHDTLRDPECMSDNCTTIEVRYPVFETAPSALIISIRVAMRSWLAGSSNVVDSTRSIPSIMEDFIEEYRDYNEDAEGRGFPWDSMNSFVVTANAPRFLCLELSGYSYTGGAHGNSNVSYYLFDTQSGKAMQWEALFTPGSRAFVRKQAESVFRTGVGMSASTTYEQAGYWFEDNKFVLNENTGIRSDGLVFYYNNYEIAPYSHGPTEVVIPPDSLASRIPVDSPLYSFWYK